MEFVRREVAGCYNGESDERTGRSRGLASTVAAPVADILEDFTHAEFEKSRRIEQKGGEAEMESIEITAGGPEVSGSMASVTAPEGTVDGLQGRSLRNLRVAWILDLLHRHALRRHRGR